LLRPRKAGTKQPPEPRMMQGSPQPPAKETSMFSRLFKSKRSKAERNRQLGRLGADITLPADATPSASNRPMNQEEQGKANEEEVIQVEQEPIHDAEEAGEQLGNVEALAFARIVQNEHNVAGGAVAPNDDVMQARWAAKSAVSQAHDALKNMHHINGKCIKVLKTFNSFAGAIATLNPYAHVAVGLLTSASQFIIDQESIDGSVASLLPKIQNVYEFLMDGDTLINTTGREDTLAQISQVVGDCTQFIVDFSKAKNPLMRLGKNLLSKVQSTVDEYNKALDDLMQQYRDRALHTIDVNVTRLTEELKIDGMSYAVGVGPITTKKCLDGTRTKILGEIIRWIYDEDANAPRILWLYGQAGKGKTAIAHTIALWFKEVGRLGSCFCFSRDRQEEHLEQKLFTTIARDMGIHHPALRRAVVDAITADDSLKTTPDVMQQWKKLISEPVSKVAGEVVGKVVIVIDALDESGKPLSRRHILSILGSMATSLPPNFHFLLTSRPSPDIQRALLKACHVRSISLDDVHAEEDICLYVRRELDEVEDIGEADIKRIAIKAGGLFEWARLASEFIR
ncbi:hypothetical protein ID866_10704, partial [Astraeus odoratus]